MTFECKTCGQPLSAETAMGGMAVPCPTCGVQVTVPGEPPRQESATSGRDNYLVRHWRGELSLGTSYWVNGFLGTLLIETVAKTLAAVEDPLSLKLYAALTLLLFATAILTSIWQFVGIWRSASNNGGSAWAALAKVGVILGVIRCVLLAWHSYIPQSEEMVSIIEGDIRIPRYEIRVLPGGMEVEFLGGMRAGCADQLNEVLSTVPQAKVLHIESPGGRILEAKKMIQLVREHGLSTYTSEECLSAATLVLMSGKERVVDAKAKVGFHAGRLPGATTSQQRGMDDLVRSIMQSAGVSEGFTSRVLATPSSNMWYPTFKEMLDAGVVTSQSIGDRFAPEYPPKDSPGWKSRNNAAQSRIVAEYPAVAVAGSPLNMEFVAEYKYQKLKDPPFLDNPEFPLEIIKIVQARRPDLASPIPERPAGP